MQYNRCQTHYLRNIPIIDNVNYLLSKDDNYSSITSLHIIFPKNWAFSFKYSWGAIHMAMTANPWLGWLIEYLKKHTIITYCFCPG